MARRKNCLPRFHGDPAEKSDEVVRLTQDVHGAAPDSREKIREGLAARMIGSGRERLTFQTLIECAVVLRQKDCSDSDTFRLEQLTGAQDQPGARTVEVVYVATVDRQLAGSAKV